jgi:predicted DsbA family dithiol-disulfide isomerase
VTSRTAEYWADYICPWCYLGLDRAAYLQDRHGFTVRWRPFELHPEVPETGIAAPTRRRSREVAADLRGALAEAGLAVAARTTWSNSRRALGLSVWAEPSPHWPALHEGLYRAYWAEGRDLGDPTVLLDVAVAAGVDRDEAMAALSTGAGEAEVRSARERALDLAIANTPAWHFGNGIVLAGAQPRATFDRVVARLDP